MHLEGSLAILFWRQLVAANTFASADDNDLRQ
jgi:hypothetical protein